MRVRPGGKTRAERARGGRKTRHKPKKFGLRFRFFRSGSSAGGRRAHRAAAPRAGRAGLPGGRCASPGGGFPGRAPRLAGGGHTGRRLGRVPRRAGTGTKKPGRAGLSHCARVKSEGSPGGSGGANGGARRVPEEGGSNPWKASAGDRGPLSCEIPTNSAPGVFSPRGTKKPPRRAIDLKTVILIATVGIQ